MVYKYQNGWIMPKVAPVIPPCKFTRTFSYVEHPLSLDMPGGETIAALLGLAILSTAMAYVLYFRILASAGATNLLLVTFLIPISAILLGSFVLGETLEFIHIVGMILIGFGLAAIDGKLWRFMTTQIFDQSKKPVG